MRELEKSGYLVGKRVQMETILCDQKNNFMTHVTLFVTILPRWYTCSRYRAVTYGEQVVEFKMEWLNGVCTRGRRPKANGRESGIRRVGSVGDTESKKRHVVGYVWVTCGYDEPII